MIGGNSIDIIKFMKLKLIGKYLCRFIFQSILLTLIIISTLYEDSLYVLVDKPKYFYTGNMRYDSTCIYDSNKEMKDTQMLETILQDFYDTIGYKCYIVMDDCIDVNSLMKYTNDIAIVINTETNKFTIHYFTNVDKQIIKQIESLYEIMLQEFNDSLCYENILYNSFYLVLRDFNNELNAYYTICDLSFSSMLMFVMTMVILNSFIIDYEFKELDKFVELSLS